MRSLFKSSVFAFFIGSLAVPSAQAAVAVIDADAPVVAVRTTCNDGGKPLNNCFTDFASLSDWVWNTRNPNAAAPLLVEIGPGNFTGNFGCQNSGHVTLRGSGMGATVLSSGSGPLSSNNCNNLVFQNFTVRNTGNLFGLGWFGGGTSLWENMELDMIGYAWFEGAGQGCSWVPGTHYWFNSRIKVRTAANSAIGYYATCDVSWFFGSEITATGTAGQAIPFQVPGGEIHVYGSVIRSLNPAGSPLSAQGAANVSVGGSMHIHGTGIDVISENANNIYALAAAAGSTIHANEASYVLQTAGGSVTRLSGAGTIRAPYLWEEGTPPNITSRNGADMTVTTDNGDGQPHLVIYSSNCTSKWYDTVTGACR